MKGLFRFLDRFWFTPVPAARLAMLRILIGCFALFLVAEHYTSWVRIGRTDANLFEPVGVVAILGEPLPAEVFQGLVLACLAANVAFILGWQYRFIGPIFGALLLWVLTYRNSWSMIYHSANLVVLHVLILGLTPAADALSLDARRRFRRTQRRNPAGDWSYGWPIRLLCAITVSAYFLAGVAKVAGPLGWFWATGEALRSQVASDAIRKEVLGQATSQLFYLLYDQVWLFTILAFGSLVLELGAPLALCNSRLGRFWAVNAFLMHWGIFLIMGITFQYHLSGVLYATFFNVERVARFRFKRKERTHEAVSPCPVHGH